MTPAVLISPMREICMNWNVARKAEENSGDASGDSEYRRIYVNAEH